MKAALIALVLLMAASSSEATTYLVNDTIPNTFPNSDIVVTGFIETDGTLGQLVVSNFVNWDINYPNLDGLGNIELTPANSAQRVVHGVFATADGIFVDFTQQSPGFPGVLAFTNSTWVPDGPSGEICFCNLINQAQHSGLYGANFLTYSGGVNRSPQIAVAVPEPATWALLLFGFAFFALKGIWPGGASR